jgi:hypothetical protein
MQVLALQRDTDTIRNLLNAERESPMENRQPYRHLARSYSPPIADSPLLRVGRGTATAFLVGLVTAALIIVPRAAFADPASDPWDIVSNFFGFSVLTALVTLFTTPIACANSLCSPSRASVLTGLHSDANGVQTLNQPITEMSDWRKSAVPVEVGSPTACQWGGSRGLRFMAISFPHHRQDGG